MLARSLRALVFPACFTLVALGCASDPPAAAESTPPEPEADADAEADAEARPEPVASSDTPGMSADAEAALVELLVRMDRELELAPGVRTEVHEALTDQLMAMGPHLAAIEAEGSRSAKIRVARAHREQMQAIRERTEVRLRELLDEAQYARYEELRRELRDELRPTMQARHG